MRMKNITVIPQIHFSIKWLCVVFDLNVNPVLQTTASVMYGNSDWVQILMAYIIVWNHWNTE